MVPNGLAKIADGKTLLCVANTTADTLLLPEGARVAQFKCMKENEFFLLDVPEDQTDILEGELLHAELTSGITEEIEGLDLSDTCLKDTELRHLRNLLAKNKDVFSKGDIPGLVHGVEHTIKVGDAEPISVPRYHAGKHDREAISEHTKKMLIDEVIRPSNSPWSSPVVMVPKKDGKLRFCIDYRRLNAITKKDVYPLPRIDDLLAATQNARYFSALDITWGYWNLPIKERDKAKTAFATHEGLFEFNRMPFGLTNAPATFQRLMDAVTRGMNWVSTLVYLDDIIVFSSSFSEHLEHLTQLFARLRDANLKLKASKCLFCRHETPYLGHVITRDGFVKMDPRKVEAVKNFPVPRTLKELQRFLGLAGYYRHFICDFAKIAVPLTDMTAAGTRILLEGKALFSFEKIKMCLASAPVLRRVDYSRPFLLQTDASGIAIGAILSQKDDNGREYVIGYGSKKLTPAQRKWDTREQEAFAAIWGCEFFRHYVLGSPFELQTDHESLKWLNSPRSTGKLARWAIRLSEFNFTPKYRPGKQHMNVDALSHIENAPESMEIDLDIPTYGDSKLTREITLKESVITTLSSNAAGMQMDMCAAHGHHSAQLLGTLSVASFDEQQYCQQFAKDQAADPELGKIIQVLGNQVPPGFDDMPEYVEAKRHAKHMAIQNGLLVRTVLRTLKADGQCVLATLQVQPQIVVPKARRDEVLRMHHEDHLASHAGMTAMLKALTGHFYWYRMARDVRTYVVNCISCQSRKPTQPRRHGLLQPFDFSTCNHLMMLQLTILVPYQRPGMATSISW